MGSIPINNNESSNVLRGIKVRVNTRHDKAYNTLCQDPSNQAIFRPNPITQESADEGTRDVEGIDERAPAEGYPKGVRIADDEKQPRRRIN